MGGRGKYIRCRNATLNQDRMVECSRVQGRDNDGVFVMAGSRGRKRPVRGEKPQSLACDSSQEWSECEGRTEDEGRQLKMKNEGARGSSIWKRGDAVGMTGRLIAGKRSG